LTRCSAGVSDCVRVNEEVAREWAANHGSAVEACTGSQWTAPTTLAIAVLLPPKLNADDAALAPTSAVTDRTAAIVTARTDLLIGTSLGCVRSAPATQARWEVGRSLSHLCGFPARCRRSSECLPGDYARRCDPDADRRLSRSPIVQRSRKGCSLPRPTSCCTGATVTSRG
jgi:hypothetical protein